jgi:ATP-binding cassette subfamily B multidrug efflux pump
MRIDYGFFEEDKLGKPYDLKLLRRLLSYARSYKNWIAVSILFILIVTGIDLLLPYLTKLAIDNYIVISARRVLLSEGLNPLEVRLQRNYGSQLIATNIPNVFFIKSLDLNAMDPSDLAQFQSAGIIQEKRFLVTRVSSLEQKEIIGRYPQRIEFHAGHAFMAYEDLHLLSKADLLMLRAADIEGVIRISLIFLSVLILGFAFHFSQVYLVEYVGQRLMFDLRMDLFSHLQRLSILFFDRTPVGRLVTRITNDVQNLHEMITSLVVTLFRDLFLLGGIVIVLLKINKELALVSFIVVPVIFLVTTVFSRLARDAFREVRTKIAKINSSLQENISGIRVIQAFRREHENYRRFRRINYENYVANIRQIVIFAIFVPLIEFLGMAAIALLIWYGGGKVLSETISLGTLVAFLSYIRMFFRPIRDLSEKYNIMQSAMASAERVFLLLDERSLIRTTPVPRIIKDVKGHIEFKQVDFAYSPGEWVLKDVSFEVRPGETVAIVGATGAGKTSIINLLERFYDLQNGQILLDGVDVRDLDKSFLRSQIGLVMQDVFLFAGDIRENIVLRQKHISDEELLEISKYVNADQFISKLPEGFDEEVKEGGVTLSTGQRQLLAFARALAYNPKILILDEATSHVDLETERLIQEALAKLMENRTSIVIAHRLSTIQNAHRIIVLHKGEIREVGTHADLLARRGLYHKIYQVQYEASLHRG